MIDDREDDWDGKDSCGTDERGESESEGSKGGGRLRLIPAAMVWLGVYKYI